MKSTVEIRDREEFKESALKLFRWQSERCAPYREYISLLGVVPSEVKTLEEIPFLPIELFKREKIYCGVGEPEMVFTSSSTTGQTPSCHYMSSLKDYESVFSRAFSLFYGNIEERAIYALLPSYLEREGSSLIYMIDKLIEQAGGGFYLYNHEKLLHDMASDPKEKILFGVSYALLDLVESFSPKLEKTIVMETGGMKGRRKELTKSELHSKLMSSLGVESIHSEFGMAELTSQAYSMGDGLFYTPPWMEIVVRDLNDPFSRVGEGKQGGVNIIDLANRDSCAFIQSEDLGVKYDVVSRESIFGNFESRPFKLMGRADKSEIRGCNLLIERQ